LLNFQTSLVRTWGPLNCSDRRYSLRTRVTGQLLHILLVNAIVHFKNLCFTTEKFCVDLTMACTIHLCAIHVCAGAICPQNFALLKLLPFEAPIPELISEDCLYLNIWTPSLDSASRLPVMFRIHGGGFNCGKYELYCRHELTLKRKCAMSMLTSLTGIHTRLSRSLEICGNDCVFVSQSGCNMCQ
jgi:Carboxylesterase family